MNEVFITDAPDAEHVALIAGGLVEFNRVASGIDDNRPLAVLIRDKESGKVVGGLTGRTSLGLFFLDLIYVPDELRASGLGAEILRQAEDEARARGCRSAVVYTISFQAPGFYQKNGWRIFGEVPCDPPGTSRIYLQKDLTSF